MRRRAGLRTTLVVSRENLHDEPHVRSELSRRLGSGTRVVDGLGAVSVIGAGINSTYGNLRAGHDALANAGIIASGTATSSFRITWMIPRDRTGDAARALHGRFIEDLAQAALISLGRGSETRPHGSWQCPAGMSKCACHHGEPL